MTDEIRKRIYSVDLLRGVVMMIMMLDHVREFVHAGALTSDPTSPATTTHEVFFTRWITHFCAPTFVFLSGVSIYLQKLNGKSDGDLSRFLFTRGLSLIFLEFTVVRLITVFNLDYTYAGMAQVIWVIGVSMVVMAAGVYLPARVVGLIGVAMIVLHNLLDRFQVPPQSAFGGQPPMDLGQNLWVVLHQPGIVQFFGGASHIFFGYPLVPWIGVMAAGYWLGTVYAGDDDRRRRLLLTIGVAASLLFIGLRFANVYGDLVPWSQHATPARTFLSFLNVTKYPPSLLFLLMTLGPAMIIIALTDRIDGRAMWQRIAMNFGRVPMFYYILQWLVAHLAGVLLGYFAGKDVSYLFADLLQMGQKAPPNYGFPLWVAYAVWITGLVVLYPICAWYGDYKRRKKSWILSYL
jgi:uncharacterized membrane protein